MISEYNLFIKDLSDKSMHLESKKSCFYIIKCMHAIQLKYVL